MTQLRMIPEPYLRKLYLRKYKASGDEILTQCTLIHLLNILQEIPSEIHCRKKLYKKFQGVSDVAVKPQDLEL
jgi:hypothetical protein